jgi:predicted acyl esterase
MPNADESASPALEHGVKVEKDVLIPMRDGAMLRGDLFRPIDDAPCPAIVTISVYQKDKVWIPPPDLEEPANPYMTWETVNPLWWVPRGYAIVRVDSRGSGKSPGHSDPNSYQEAIDFYDAIEWVARQPWCTGKVGTCGISYHANSQWRVASLQPPSLKAIIPWEGRADAYRDQAFHGGIFGLGFLTNWYSLHTAHHLLGSPQSANPDAFHNDMLWQMMNHSLDSEWWTLRSARWDRIKVPMLSAGNWSGFSLHLRGNTEGFMLAASEHKKLRIHHGTHFHAFYSEEGRQDQFRFFEHWLKNVDTGFMNEPPVKLLIRTGDGAPYQWRFENEWPLARTQWTKYYLTAQAPSGESSGGVEGGLSTVTPAEASELSYPASGSARAGVASASALAHARGIQDRTGVSFVTPPLEEDTEVTGPIVLTLWVSSSSHDMDIFATLRNIGEDGKDCFEMGQDGQLVPVTKGWLRVSHRKLDPERSLPYRPFHAHDERQPLRPGQVVECQVEIWPTCMVFRKGHRIRLDVQPRDGIGSAPYTHYHAEYNTGATNIIHLGADTPSHLLLPIIPAKKG